MFGNGLCGSKDGAMDEAIQGLTQRSTTALFNLWLYVIQMAAVSKGNGQNSGQHGGPFAPGPDCHADLTILCLQFHHALLALTRQHR